MPRVNWGELNSPARIVVLGGAVPMVLLFVLLSTVTVEREVTCLPESAPPWLTNQYVLLLAYVYWPTHIYLFKEQGQTPSATVAMMRPPATLQP